MKYKNFTEIILQSGLWYSRPIDNRYSCSQTRMALRKDTALDLTGSQALGWEPILGGLPPPVA